MNVGDLPEKMKGTQKVTPTTRGNQKKKNDIGVTVCVHKLCLGVDFG